MPSTSQPSLGVRTTVAKSQVTQSLVQPEGPPIQFQGLRPSSRLQNLLKCDVHFKRFSSDSGPSGLESSFFSDPKGLNFVFLPTRENPSGSSALNFVSSPTRENPSGSSALNFVFFLPKKPHRILNAYSSTRRVSRYHERHTQGQ
jgi:hypothetical protein